MNSIDRKTFIRTFLFVLGLPLLSGVHAQEGNCPPGYQPIGVESGQDGPQGCAPAPGEDQQQPPARWADRWGAIATDAKKGSLGKTTNQASQNSAEQIALAECQSKGGVVCKIDLSYRNQCVAMLVSPKGYNVSSGDTVNIAIETGMKICTNAGDANCHVYYSACSLPVRIQ